MSVSDHKIVAVQGATQVQAIFTVKFTQPLDDRIKDEITDIGTKVDDLQNDVADIQASAIHMEPFHGLLEVPAD